MSKTVFVGLSGGVDSAVSAALLKEQGYNVAGVFIKIWQPEFIECTWAKDRLDAMRVCVSLGIPFQEIDLSSDYKRTVVDDMISAYSRGITPNPDVLCNRHIKFGSFMNYARKEGADYIATGHYARVALGDRRFTQKEPKNVYKLLRGSDNNKDQSYFLYLLKQDDLVHTLFPVGNLLKSEVRKLAAKFSLPVAEKSDSQGLCFVGDVTMKDFLSRYMKLDEGKVIDTNGTCIGSHEGAALYTIGQRHGFTTERLAGDRTPYYVVSVNIPANTITVSTRRDDATQKDIRIDSMHWISGAPEMPLRAQTQARYREKPSEATISVEGGGVSVAFDEPQIAAAGQSIVVYNDDTCLGGGTIEYQSTNEFQSTNNYE
ncbi:MAG: tRNA 2-thiouridine(34) synthase MnmA [bacterium]|nr:tRNA 2-thiouridine(34) synthase MnmA [bacterium]